MVNTIALIVTLAAGAGGAAGGGIFAMKYYNKSLVDPDEWDNKKIMYTLGGAFGGLLILGGIVFGIFAACGKNPFGSSKHSSMFGCVRFFISTSLRSRFNKRCFKTKQTKVPRDGNAWNSAWF